MSTTRHPAITWSDAAGRCTAVLIGDDASGAAYAGTLKEALQHLTELLQWRMEHEPWNVDPDFREATLLEVKVEVLPQYKVGSRIIPCPETIWLRVPCVTGLQENGLRVCAVPHLGLRFNYQDPDALKSLVAHYVKEALQGHSPLELAGNMPPRGCQLSEIVLRDSTEQRKWIPPENRPDLKILFSVADPLLQDLGRKRGASAAYGREDLSNALLRKLSHEKANILLVGEPGVGKSTLLLDAVKRLVRARPKASGDTDEERAETGLHAYQFWRGNAARMIAGMRYLGEWEERCERFIERLNAMDGVYCVESLLTLLQVGGEGPGDSVAAFLLPYLQRRELRMVTEATPGELEACRRLLPGLLDVFQIVTIPAFSDPEAVEVLTRLANAHATAARVELDPGVVVLAHKLFKRFLPYAAFPGPAANFIHTLLDRPTLPEKQRSITLRDVVTLFIKRTGLPEMFLQDHQPLHVEKVREHFNGRIIGQPEATLAAARQVTMIKAGLNDPERPFGVLLFCGPTGVGKTALAKELAEFCFGAGAQKDRLVRLDMSEYAGPFAASRFLQAPNGNPAPWVDRIRSQPFSVLLFDEIEKAAPPVFDALLGLLDEGRLTDPLGRVTNFRSTIIILTSNLGSRATAAAGFGSDQTPPYEAEVGKFFRPEFFNRLDAVITFKPLSPGEVESIARKELRDLAAREGFAGSGIRLEWSERLVAAVAREGYDHSLGARPLQRSLERIVVTPLARWKVAHPNERDIVLRLDCDLQGEVTISANY